MTAGHWDIAKGTEEAAYEQLLEKGATAAASCFRAVDGGAGGVQYKLQGDEAAGDDAQEGEEAAKEAAAAVEAEDAVREAVFAQMHIPRTLEEITVLPASISILPDNYRANDAPKHFPNSSSTPALLVNTHHTL